MKMMMKMVVKMMMMGVMVTDPAVSVSFHLLLRPESREQSEPRDAQNELQTRSRSFILTHTHTHSLSRAGKKK